jgi:hypothetical protein
LNIGFEAVYAKLPPFVPKFPKAISVQVLDVSPLAGVLEEPV